MFGEVKNWPKINKIDLGGNDELVIYKKDLLFVRWDS